jgi:hypothetical protein
LTRISTDGSLGQGVEKGVSFMSWDNELDEDGIIVSRVWGSLNDDEVVAKVLELVELIKHSGATGCLSDFREVQSEVSIVKLYELPVLYDEIGVSRMVRQALLLPITKHRMRDYKFYEDVCQNQGYNFRLFECPDEARQWLLEG